MEEEEEGPERRRGEKARDKEFDREEGRLASYFSHTSQANGSEIRKHVPACSL